METLCLIIAGAIALIVANIANVRMWHRHKDRNLYLLFSAWVFLIDIAIAGGIAVRIWTFFRGF